MRLKQVRDSKKCEIKNCKNQADFSVDVKGIFKDQFYICEECLRKMFKGYMATSVPKSIESPFKPNKRIRKEKV